MDLKTHQTLRRVLGRQVSARHALIILQRFLSELVTSLLILGQQSDRGIQSIDEHELQI